jgi:argininosuccinate lyase
VDVAAHNVDVILPGFTHLQVAQPVSFAHHLLAYVEMFAATPSAWPTCAAAPTACRWAAPPWPAPPTRWTASAWRAPGHGRRTGEPQVCQNSLDGVSDRDFAIEFTAAASLCMVHISR